jgi:flavodoxin
MKALIIYESFHHGNTKKVAEAMAGELDAELAMPRELDIKGLNAYDLIGFGSGIYKGRFHRNIRSLIDNLPPMNKKVFLFYTCGMDLGSRYTNEVADKLVHKGFDVVGKFSCPGWDTIPAVAWFGGIKKGHPNARDLERARAFAKSLQ